MTHAGGKLPLWQLAHWLVTTPCVWLNALGRQALNERWHTSHDCAPTGMWVEDLPVARLPLWQVAQVPGTTLT